MKRAWLLVAVLIVALGLGVGCTVVETYDDEGQEIDISVGKEFIIALGSNPSTGYSWQADFDEAMLELVGGEPTYEADETDEPAMGAGGVDYFRFLALEVGETEITLTYAQPWEGGAVGQTKVFTVNIES